MNIDLNSMARAALRATTARRLAVACAALMLMGAGQFPDKQVSDARAADMRVPDVRVADMRVPDVRLPRHEAGEGDNSQVRFEMAGRVVRVADGDTITVLVDGKQQRVRLASIDAPEVDKDRDRPGQPYAKASRDNLADMIAGKTVTLRCYERDRFERSICDVMLPGGETANQRQVAAGMAWANMEKRGKLMRDKALPGLEDRARIQRRGIWQDPHPQRPWEWRYFCWQKQECRK